MPITFSAIANREVRTIPKGWKHPKDERGRDLALWPSDKDTQEHFVPAWRFMPTVEAGTETEIAAYETTSEGTPITPAFPDTPAGRLALVNYCAEHATTWADNKADAETWAAILFGDEAATVDLDDGTVHFA
jgi:hypothetical protein